MSWDTQRRTSSSFEQREGAGERTVVRLREGVGRCGQQRDARVIVCVGVRGVFWDVCWDRHTAPQSTGATAESLTDAFESRNNVDWRVQ